MLHIAEVGLVKAQLLLLQTQVHLLHTLILDANITATVDFTNTDMASGAEHGTHVAGIAGAERNGEGMHGAAFDANLAIAKVSSGNFYSFANAIKAAEWGKSLGSAAINVSAEMNYDSAFRDQHCKNCTRRILQHTLVLW